MNVTHEQLRERLKRLNINQAVVDDHTWQDGSPAILLRWNDAEEYYVGYQDGGYEGRLRAQFADENLVTQASG